MATGDLTTLANLKAYLGLTATSDDSQLALYITAASKLAATYCDRSFASAERTYTRSGTGSPAMPLPEYPVTAIASLTIDGVAVSERASVGARGWVLVDNQIVLDGGLVFPRGAANVTCAYTAGYETTPKDLEFACIETVASWYRRKSRIDEQSKSIQGETISFSTRDIPETARAILDTYRRLWLR